MCEPVVLDVEEYYINNDENAILAWGRLYRKELFEGVSYPVGKVYEDEYTTHIPLFTTPKVALVSTPLYYYFINPNGIMGNTRLLNRLQAADAFPQRLDFLENKGYKKACNKTISLYKCFLIRNIRRVKDTNDLKDKKDILKDLRRRLKGVIKLSKIHGISEGGTYICILWQILFLTVFIPL